MTKSLKNSRSDGEPTSDDLVGSLVRLGRTITLSANDIYHPYSDVGSAIVIVLEGALDCVMLSPNALEFVVQRIEHLDIICAPEIDEHTSLLCERTYVAAQPTRLVSIPLQRYVQALGEDQGLAAYLLSSCARQIERCYQKVYECTFLPANIRIYWYLYRHSRSFVDWFKIDTHQVIANHLAVTRETVSREITNLLSSGVIERQHRFFRIVDEKELLSRVRRHLRYQSRLLPLSE